MKKFFLVFLSFCFLFCSSGVAMGATVLGLTLTKEALIFSPKDTSVPFKIFNNTTEPQDYFLSLAPLMLEGGKYVESPAEKGFLDSLSVSPGKVVKGLPPNQAQTITVRLGKTPGEDHQVVLFVRQALKKKSAEQTTKKTAGAQNVPNVGIQVIFLAKKDPPKGKVLLDLSNKKIQIQKISRSFLYGELSVIGIDAEGKEDVLSKFNLFVRNDRWIDLPPDFSKFGKIRVHYVEYGGKNVILDQTLSVLGKGFISFYGNNTLVSSDFPCFMKESGAEVLVDAKEFAFALGFYSEEKKGVIRGTIFGKPQWFKVDNLNGTASNYNTPPFKLSSSFYGLLTVEELAKVFGLDVEYNRWELFLSVKTRKREKFAFQVIDDLKSKMIKTEEPEKRGRDSAAKIPCLTADYSLYNQNNGNGNNTCGARLNFAVNISDFIFSGEQRISGNGDGGEFVNKQLAYFNEKFNFQINSGELNRLSQSPFRQGFCGLGNGIEIFSLSQNNGFPVKGKEILPAARGDEVAGCWFNNSQYIDQNSTIFFHRGTNPVLHHYLTKYGEEKRDYQFFAIPQNHPGEGKFSFYAGGLRGEDDGGYFYNVRLDYGLAKNVISVGKADEIYVSLVSPFRDFILDGISELREKPRYRINLSTLNLAYGRLCFNASADEKKSLSLNGETRIGLLRIANNIKKEKEIEDRFSFSFSPYRRISCSADFLANENSGLKESRYFASYSFRRHRFEASLLKRNANLYFPRLGYDYKIGPLNFNLEFEFNGKNPDRIYCSVFYFFEYGQMSQSSYYNAETNQLSADSRFSGSVIAAKSNLDFYPESSMRQAKVLVLVFMDKNFNGTFEEKVDKPLKAKITVDGKSSRYSTSEKGSAWIKISTPDKSLIGVEDASLPPQAFAGEPVLVKIFAPISMKVEIPVYLGGEIMGVEQGGAVEIHLLNKKGVLISKADVYSDGTFYFNKVIPGDYTLVAGDRKKEVSIKIDEQGDPISALDVVIKPR
ncbi:MAG: hypothetical protein V1688_04605 [bacterium]